MTAREQLTRFLELLEQVPDIGGDPQLGGFLLMAKQGLPLTQAEPWCQLIDQIENCWRQAKAEARAA